MKSRRGSFLKLYFPSVILLITLCGCSLVTGSARKDMLVEKPVKYEVVFDDCVKACRDLDMTIGMTNRDAGQIDCSSAYSPLKPRYELNIILEKEQGFMKKVDVKAAAYSEGFPPSDAETRKVVERYLDALKRRLDVR